VSYRGLVARRSLSVRLDEGSAVALAQLTAEGRTSSEAVRVALAEAAARRRTGACLREESRRLAADPVDRVEMKLIREEMAELAPGRSA